MASDVTDYISMDTDDLHIELDDWKRKYDEANFWSDYDRRTACVKELTEISTVLRQRGELWIRLTDEDLLYRYRAAFAMADSDVEEFKEDFELPLQEFQAEIQRRGLTVPMIALPLDEAVTYWFSEGHVEEMEE